LGGAQIDSEDASQEEPIASFAKTESFRSDEPPPPAPDYFERADVPGNLTDGYGIRDRLNSEDVPSAEIPHENHPCPACGNKGAKPLARGTDRLYGTTAKEFQVVECRTCKLIRLFPWPEPAELARYYPDDYWFVPEGSTVSLLEETYRRFVLRDHVHFAQGALKHAAAGTKGKVLDVGCGGGLFLRMLAERGHSVVGLDFSVSAAAAAWRQNSVPAICGNLAEPPLPASSFDLVTMYHVLEHLYDPAGYLDIAHKLLKPDGRLIVQVPNAACWQFLLMGEMWSGIDIPRHLFDFRDKDVETLLEHCGFEVVRRKYFSLRDNPAGVVSSLAPWLDPMARRIRKTPETERQRLMKDLLYLGFTVMALPLTVVEAACRAGANIMFEARKKK
jgi:SAM-dependent methyltransferase